MTRILTTTAALLLTTTAASAGGLERAATTFGPLFEDGNHVELSYGFVQPEVSGSLPTPAGALETGTVSPDYSTLGAALKFDVTDNVSVAIIIDEPYGADVTYPSATGYPLQGADAGIDALGLTILGRYKFNENYSIYYGPRAVTMDGFLNITTSQGVYDATYEEDTAYGYVVGAAYERPEIALRVALTYSSELSFSHDTTVAGVPDAAVADTEYTLPETITLDFQSGVAEDTLVFGSIRYADWTQTEINSFGFPSNPVVSYSDPATTYTLGVGRRFTEQFSGSVAVSYEAENDGIASNLAPTDGFTSISVGGAYDLGNGIEVSGGVRYIMVGDAETQVPIPGVGVLTSDFSENDALALGLKVAYKF